MATSYTSLLSLALPATGELSGTWGQTVNDYITQYLDAAIAGAQTISGSQTAVTLSAPTGVALVSAGAGATGSSQYSIINCTGNPASTLTVTVPSTSKVYLVINATSTSQSVIVKPSGNPGITVAAGRAALIAWNGSDFVRVATNDLSAMGASGNVGIGVTPSAWESTCRMLQLGDVGTVGRANSGQTQLGFNYFINSSNSYIYIQALNATRYEQISGEHRWFNAAVGTVGGTISFTQRMTLDASGRLLVGTTTAGIGNNNATALSLSGGTTVYQSIRSSGGQEMYLYTDGGGTCGVYSYTNIPLLFGTNNTERMRLDTSGNLGIGTTSPSGFRVRVVSASADADVIRWENSASSIYAVSGVSTTNSLAYTGTGTNNAFAFITNNTERMRLDTSGNLQFDSGYGSVATAYGCRAWVNFNGTGTPARRGWGNVNSITDNGVGDYTVNFASSMPDANYAAIATCSNDSSGFNIPGSVSITNQTTAGVQLQVRDSGGGNVDRTIVTCAVFR
jgi:hypothetical protein